MPHALRSCPACGGFAPATLAACPHCEAALPARRTGRLARTLASLVGAGGFAVTLMACYGAMPYRSEQPQPEGYCGYGNTADSDGDSYCSPQDCNDTNAAVFPGAEDPDLDSIDQNCDGVDGWRDPNSVAEPAAIDAGAAPVEPVPIATDPPPPPATP